MKRVVNIQKIPLNINGIVLKFLEYHIFTDITDALLSKLTILEKTGAIKMYDVEQKIDKKSSKRK